MPEKGKGSKPYKRNREGKKGKIREKSRDSSKKEPLSLFILQY
jgi:hypothetical protein